MDTFGSATKGEVIDVPEQLRTLFNNPDDVKVEKLPCALPGLGSMAVRFAAGARTVPHVHHGGQHLVFVEGSGVVGDDHGVHVVHTGDVVSSPPGGWHWHGALPGMPATHVTFEQPGDFDREVDRRDWDRAYPHDLGT
jgi:mannose-6-phosphate isomerase-like protein (cupin superfamily)